MLLALFLCDCFLMDEHEQIVPMLFAQERCDITEGFVLSGVRKAFTDVLLRFFEAGLDSFIPFGFHRLGACNDVHFCDRTTSLLISHQRSLTALLGAFLLSADAAVLLRLVCLQRLSLAQGHPQSVLALLLVCPSSHRTTGSSDMSCACASPPCACSWNRPCTFRLSPTPPCPVLCLPMRRESVAQVLALLDSRRSVSSSFLLI